MSTILVVFHIIFSLLLTTLILMQPGKESGMESGAGMMGMTGASQTLFGSRGSGSFMTKLTSFIACVFFATSIGLGLFYTYSSTDDIAALFSKQDTLTETVQSK